MKARLGILAYSSPTGLGYQTYGLYKHLKPKKVLVADLSSFNQMPVDHAKYKRARVTNGIPNTRDIDWLLTGVDAVFVCETPLNYDLFKEANKRGVVTILQPNFEFNDYLQNVSLPKPTVFALPSLWNINRMDRRLFPNITHLPVPIDQMPQRDLKQARVFFHIGGLTAAGDRNGTDIFIAAVRLAKQYMPDARFILYAQRVEPERIQAARTLGIEIVKEVADSADLYKDGDVLVLPRRYGGLCLPAQEAIGCGIPVIMPKIDPNTRWMPGDWLTAVGPRTTTLKTRTQIMVFQPSPRAVAIKMIDWYKRDDLFRKAHLKAQEIGSGLSWEARKVQYETLIDELVSKCISQ